MWGGVLGLSRQKKREVVKVNNYQLFFITSNLINISTYKFVSYILVFTWHTIYCSEFSILKHCLLSTKVDLYFEKLRFYSRDHCINVKVSNNT
jgi:hypothetical protein